MSWLRLPFPARYLVPNGITAGVLVLGLASAVASVEGAYTWAGWLIVWGVLLDTMDGAAARLLDARSALGAELDSFADMVVFGLAPATLVYARLSATPLCGPEGAGRPWMLAALALYLLATALRLARYNLHDAATDGDTFRGIPTTTCGGVTALLYLCWERADLAEVWLYPLPALSVVLAVAMLSSPPLPKLRPRSGHTAFNAGLGLCVLLAYTLGPLRMLPEVLLLMTLSAIGGGLLWSWRQGR